MQEIDEILTMKLFHQVYQLQTSWKSIIKKAVNFDSFFPSYLNYFLINFFVTIFPFSR